MGLQTDKNYNIEEFDRPSVTVDVLLFTVHQGELKVLLIQRNSWPFEGFWALPGGFVQMDESLDEAAKRKLSEETGMLGVYLEQLYTFGGPKRDPRTRVVTVSYFALVPSAEVGSFESSDIRRVQWFGIRKLPELAFDHAEIIGFGVERLRNKIQYSSLAYGLLPDRFRFSDMQKIYEVILDKKLDKRNFRKQMMSLGLLEETGEKVVEGAHRPAMLYKFKKRDLVIFD